MASAKTSRSRKRAVAKRATGTLGIKYDSLTFLLFLVFLLLVAWFLVNRFM